MNSTPITALVGLEDPFPVDTTGPDRKNPGDRRSAAGWGCSGILRFATANPTGNKTNIVQPQGTIPPSTIERQNPPCDRKRDRSHLPGESVESRCGIVRRAVPAKVFPENIPVESCRRGPRSRPRPRTGLFARKRFCPSPESNPARQLEPPPWLDRVRTEQKRGPDRQTQVDQEHKRAYQPHDQISRGPHGAHLPMSSPSLCNHHQYVPAWPWA